MPWSHFRCREAEVVSAAGSAAVRRELRGGGRGGGGLEFRGTSGGPEGFGGVWGDGGTLWGRVG